MEEKYHLLDPFYDKDHRGRKIAEGAVHSNSKVYMNSKLICCVAKVTIFNHVGPKMPKN